MKTTQMNNNPADKHIYTVFETLPALSKFEICTQVQYKTKSSLALVDLDLTQAIQLRDELTAWIESRN